MTSQHTTFRCMGTKIELWAGGVPTPRAERALAGGKAFLTGFDQTLSRFKADSELTALNSDARETVPVSRLMSQFLEAAIWAAEASHGIVDPTLVDAMQRVGYEESREGKTSIALTEALAEAPPFALAKPDPAQAWCQLKLNKAERTLTRPAGLMVDSGGSGKGLAADMLASIWKVILGDRGSFVIDCGGDIRVSANGPLIDVKVADPFSERVALVIPVQGKGIATSGIGKRVWRQQDGSVTHHLIDPRTGEAAWTGIVAVTAVADSTLIAETIAKTALLSGPEVARMMLSEQGGVIVHASGDVEEVSLSSQIERAA